MQQEKDNFVGYGDTVNCLWLNTDMTSLSDKLLTAAIKNAISESATSFEVSSLVTSQLVSNKTLPHVAPLNPDSALLVLKEE